MYHRIVRQRITAVFDSLSRGDASAMIDALAADFRYEFHGEHALGGVRTTSEAMTRWWERVFRLLPGARFDVREVLVTGAPWSTRVAARIRVRGPIPGGEYDNTIFQFMTLRWGRVCSVETLEDLQTLERALGAVAAAGAGEALAAPITDEREAAPTIGG